MRAVTYNLKKGNMEVAEMLKPIVPVDKTGNYIGVILYPNEPMYSVVRTYGKYIEVESTKDNVS